MSLGKEKFRKMMSFRKICSLFIVNRQSTCQSQMFKRDQVIYHSAGLFSTNQILLGKFIFLGSLTVSEVDQDAVWW